MTDSLKATMRVVREHWFAALLALLSAAAYATDIKRDHHAMLTLLCADHPTDSLCGGKR